MSAAPYTPEEEATYRLRPLPIVPVLSVEEASERNAAYEASRIAYRAAHPDRVKGSE